MERCLGRCARVVELEHGAFQALAGGGVDLADGGQGIAARGGADWDDAGEQKPAEAECEHGCGRECLLHANVFLCWWATCQAGGWRWWR